MRSGKAVGRSFVERHDEHKKASQLTEVSTRESKFYTSYPSKTAELGCDASRRGYFDNLEQRVAFGFDWATEGAIDGLTADAADGGIFHFSEGKKKRIERVNFQGENTLKGKQLHCLGYLMELAYDLALASRDNVSSSPGFETCIGFFRSGAVC